MATRLIVSGYVIDLADSWTNDSRFRFERADGSKVSFMLEWTKDAPAKTQIPERMKNLSKEERDKLEDEFVGAPAPATSRRSCSDRKMRTRQGKLPARNEPLWPSPIRSTTWQR
ncbi:MAG: hypothetical protein HC923_08805 [Myxococcales bacterium]|nr:hypothetical protein [Myxococcales bacterium]